MECSCYLRNVQDLLGNGKTHYEIRMGEPLKGPIIPFGALIEYHPISPKDQPRIHQFGKKVLPGIFLGSELVAGKIWKGDILIADLEDLEKMDASDINPRRINAKEILMSSYSHFRWDSKIVRKRPRIPRIHSKARTNRKERRSQQRTSWWTWRVSPDRNQRWCWSPCRFLVDPRVTSSIVITMNLGFNSTCRRKKHSLFNWNILTLLGLLILIWMCCKRNGLTIIGMSIRADICQNLGKDSWKRNLQKDICGPGRDWQWFRPEVWTNIGKAAQNREKQKWARERPKLDNARRMRGIYSVDPDDEEYRAILKSASRKLERPMAPTIPCKKTIEHHESGCKAENRIRKEFQNNGELYSGISWIHETKSRIFAVQKTWRSHCR